MSTNNNVVHYLAELRNTNTSKRKLGSVVSRYGVDLTDVHVCPDVVSVILAVDIDLVDDVQRALGVPLEYRPPCCMDRGCAIPLYRCPEDEIKHRASIT